MKRGLIIKMKFIEKDLKIIKKLNTPSKIQDFINKIPINFEEDGKDTCMSPLSVLKKNKCHCIEGAMLAAAAIWINKIGIGKPLVVDMRGTEDDWDHVIAVFKINGKWGAITKTNHSVLRYREPVYRDVRELIMSYFHEYTSDDKRGKKTLREFSMPVDLSIFGKGWMTSEKNLWAIYNHLDKVRHFKILTSQQEKNLRRADDIEIKAGNLTEYRKTRKLKNPFLLIKKWLK